jgi:hypothetical protein
LPACFTQIDGAQHIGASVELRIGHRCAEIDLRGEMEDDVRVHTRDDVNQFRGLNVGLYQREPTRLKAVAGVRMVQVGRNARAEVVDSDDLMIVGQKSVGQS